MADSVAQLNLLVLSRNCKQMFMQDLSSMVNLQAPFEYNSGVKQGCKLVPTLYGIYAAVQGQISEHIFAVKLRLLCLLSVGFKNWGISSDIPQF